MILFSDPILDPVQMYCHGPVKNRCCFWQVFCTADVNGFDRFVIIVLPRWLLAFPTPRP